MCCFFTTLIFIGPRLAFFVYWLFPVGRVKIFLAFNHWIWPLLGLIFLPWTILAYVIFFPIVGFDWLLVGLGLAADLAGYFGGYRNRKYAPIYKEPPVYPTGGPPSEPPLQY
jgi:hypothetical protein